MPQPKSPSRYPVEFRTLFERAQGGEVIEVASSNPQSLRARLYGFARALRMDDQKELADSVQISTRAGSVIIESRSNSTQAKEVAAALAQLGDIPSPSPDALLDRLTIK
jgi:hypothetical protein